jgi:Holliday junction resolvasome RuvABC endonuclease subunit
LFKKHANRISSNPEYMNWVRKVSFVVMNILALDLGTHTGYAVCEGGHILSGTKKLPHKKSAPGLRFLDFRRWLIQIIEDRDINEVCFERVCAHSGTEAAHCYGGFMYTLASVCEEFNIKCTGIPVGTIKKFATGKGNASKEEMIAAAKLRGFEPADDNEADALAILLLSIDCSSKPTGENAIGTGNPSERAGL